MILVSDHYPSGMRTGRPAKHERTPFGERMAQAREQAGLTQDELADKLGLDQRVIAYWERRPVALRPNQLTALADALHVTTDFLLGREVKLPSPKGPPGRLRQVFEKAYLLPRSQQSKIVEFVEAYVDRYQKTS
jgi:HTH-type transcriptional regulator, cell division transcriptional repressor